MNEILRNVLLGISLAAPLGPASVAVIQNGFRRGFLQALLTGIGITLADTTYLLIVFLGLSSFINNPYVKVLILALGAIVLVYLGYQSLRDGAERFDLKLEKDSNYRNPLLAGYLINLSNPLAVIWWLGIFGSILGSSVASNSRGIALVRSSTILVGILSWHSFLSLLTHWGKKYLNKKTARIITILAGAILILFGLRLAYLALRTVF